MLLFGLRFDVFFGTQRQVLECDGHLTRLQVKQRRLVNDLAYERRQMTLTYELEFGAPQIRFDLNEVTLATTLTNSCLDSWRLVFVFDGLGCFSLGLLVFFAQPRGLDLREGRGCVGRWCSVWQRLDRVVRPYGQERRERGGGRRRRGAR